MLGLRGRSRRGGATAVGRRRNAMVCCLLLACPGSPHEDDPYNGRTRQFQLSMSDACCSKPVTCPLSACCVWCAAFHLRRLVLDYDMDKYECCQGYIPKCCCFCPGECGERSCPTCCLCIESCCCPVLSVSTSRAFIQDAFTLGSDPCDRRLIRCSNCLQILSCLCFIGACVSGSQDCIELARIIDCIADTFTLSVTGCMVAQVINEVEVYKANNNNAPITPPVTQTMMHRNKPKKGPF